MKKLFVKLVKFSIPFIIYLIIVSIVDPFSYIYANSLVKHETKAQISQRIEPHLYKMIAFENNPKTNIVIGDSRSNRFYETISVHSDKWSPLGYGGASLNEILSTFDWLVENDYKIDTLLVGLNFNLYNKFNKRMWVEENNRRKSNFFSYAFSSYTAKSTFLILKDLVSSKSDTIGNQRYQERKFWEASVKNYGKKFYDNYSYPETGYQRLSKISEYCNQKEIELIFWIPPCAKDINDITDEYGLSSENERFINDIRGLGNLYDFNSDVTITSQRSNFTDPSHLIKK